MSEKTTSENSRAQAFPARRLAVALAAAGMIGAVGGVAFEAHQVSAAAPATTAQQPAAPIGGVMMPDFSEITQRYGPAVVNIRVVEKSGASGSDDDDAPTAQINPNDPLFQFFRQFGLPVPGQGGSQRQPQQQQPVMAEGSGFIIGTDGIILTNAHVVSGAKTVTVRLTDRREYSAKVLGSDPRTDIAVLKIDAKNLPTVVLGDARDLKVGQWVLAIGSPFGFENSVTAGVVSAKGRSLPDDSFVPFIQTDVPVNPGNSGGPLINAQGQVVGINSQIYTRTGGYQGVSFAIPIDLALKIKDEIVATGHASHARLGVAVQEVNQQLADSFGLPKPEGALVANVEKGGPGDRAGLKSGDVILKANGEDISSSSDLPVTIGLAKPGSRVNLDIWRNGKPVTLSATLGNIDDKSMAKVADASDGAAHGRLGLSLRPLQPDEQRQVAGGHGLMIGQVSGAAADAGVQTGDVLLAVNGTTATSVDQVRAVVAKAQKSVALLIERDGERIFIPVHLG